MFSGRCSGRVPRQVWHVHLTRAHTNTISVAITDTHTEPYRIAISLAHSQSNNIAITLTISFADSITYRGSHHIPISRTERDTDN
jgi:hypothetical protein